MIVIMLAFHEFKNPVKWLENVKASMKSSASLVIIERDSEKTRSSWGHFMKQDEILDTVKKANFRDNPVYIVKFAMFAKNLKKNLSIA